MNTRIAKRVFYEGRVQGVGFRITVKHIAREFEVCGTVRNLRDGRVELFAEGEIDEVNAFLLQIRESALAGNIRKEIAEDVELQNPRGFEIQ